MDGKVYLVGAGPGDPDLLTVKALRVLRAADVVLYDRLVSPEVLVEASPGAHLVYAGKQAGEQETVQRWIIEQMLAYARSGKTVVRLKGGDPSVFGRGGEEWLALVESGVEVEVVPGITSAVAVPESVGIPLTFRGVAQSFAVVTGHSKDGTFSNWGNYTAVDTLVILMGVAQRAPIAAELIRAGRRAAEPVAFVERGTTREERVVTATLGEVAGGSVEIESPAVFIVGEVVRFREQLTASANLARLVAAGA